MLRASLALMLLTSPAFAAVEGKPFFSLYNTDLIVLIAFLIFVGILVYYKVPGKLTGFLDQRGTDIQGELDEARRLREEAVELHAEFERHRAEAEEKAKRLVLKAKEDAVLAAEQAKEDIKATIARRLKAAEDKIASAEAAAIRDIRERAAALAVAAAGDVIARQMTPEQRNTLVDEAIAHVEARLH